MTLALLLPFLGKPFHLDDPVYLAMARQVGAHHLHPYDFLLNWYGKPLPMWRIMLNPPGLGYLLAPPTRLLGEREVLLHAVFLVFPLVAVQSAYDIARRFTARAELAVLLFATAPLFAVSATTLMADVPALAFALLLAVRFSYWISARFLLPALLPIVLLSMRSAGGRTIGVAVAFSALLSLAASFADLDLARSYRRAAEQLHARHGALGRRLLVRWHWGFQY